MHRSGTRIGALCAAAALGLLVACVIALWPLRPASFATVRAQYRPSDAYLLDRHGALLDSQRVEFGVRRLAWTPLEEISPAMLDAVVQAEDRRFWMHPGIDPAGVVAAVREGLFGSGRRGASTITMQLGLLLEAGRPQHAAARSWTRKLHQVRLALGLESIWSKRQILEAYLNLLPYRRELVGIRAAAEQLAGKDPSGLSMQESQVLAALLPHPSASPQRVAQRACTRLERQGQADQCAAVRELAIALLGGGASRVSGERLAPQLASALLSSPGERVRTTLDAAVQTLVRDALTRQLQGLGARNVRDGAALVVDNATGDVLAYVGSAGPNSHAALVDGIRARRQAGSTLKPFLYELALERRYVTAASLLEDSPVTIDTATGLYLPQDYDHTYKGPVSVRTALAGSLNVPAVRTLMLVGVEAFRDRLQHLGYAGITEDGAYYGYSLALGSAEVSLWEQAQAYRSLALGGRLSTLRLLASDAAVPAEPLLRPDAAFIVGSILSDPAARAVTFGLDNSLATPFWSAVKTGTSKDMRDNWCIGFSTRYTVAVWVGNFEGDSMHDVSGVTGAAPVWRAIMEALHEGTVEPAPRAPVGLSEEPVHYAAAIEPPRTEWFLAGTAPRAAITGVGRDTPAARISSPSNGMIIALDPDIPPAVQRVALTTSGSAAGLVLRLDGATVGRATQPTLWQPTRGIHHLTLEDDVGRTVDRMVFTVR